MAPAYTTMEQLAIDLGQTRSCLQQRLKKLHWTSEDLKIPQKLAVFIALKESPHLAIKTCVDVVLKLRGALHDLSAEHRALKADHEELKQSHEKLKEEFAFYKSTSQREIKDLKAMVKELQNKVSPDTSFADIEAEFAVNFKKGN